jgi:hypothetical protein
MADVTITRRAQARVTYFSKPMAELAEAQSHPFHRQAQETETRRPGFLMVYLK